MVDESGGPCGGGPTSPRVSARAAVSTIGPIERGGLRGGVQRRFPAGLGELTLP